MCWVIFYLPILSPAPEKRHLLESDVSTKMGPFIGVLSADQRSLL